jgi:hypothetical protein
MENCMNDDITLKDYVDTLFRQYKESHDKEHRLIEKSVDAARDAMDIRLDHMNEFRAQIQSERGDFVTRERFNAVTEILSTRLGNLEVAFSDFKGRVLGIGSGIAVFLVIIELVLRFAVK